MDPNALSARPKEKFSGTTIPFYAVVVEGMLPIRVDPQKVLQCYRQHLCGVCGAKLDYWLIFLGGSENRRLRSFPHPPMHRECAEHLLAQDRLWSVPETERTLAWEKEVAELGIKGEIDGALYVTRGFEFNNRTRMFEPHAPKEG